MTRRESKLYLNSLRVRARIKAFGWLAQRFETVAGAKFTFRRDIVPREYSFRRGGEAVEANIRELNVVVFLSKWESWKRRGICRQVCWA